MATAKLSPKTALPFITLCQAPSPKKNLSSKFPESLKTSTESLHPFPPFFLFHNWQQNPQSLLRFLQFSQRPKNPGIPSSSSSFCKTSRNTHRGLFPAVCKRCPKPGANVGQQVSGTKTNIMNPENCTGPGLRQRPAHP